MVENAEDDGNTNLDVPQEEELRAKMLEQRIDAVNSSSATARNNWVFFLLLMVYLAIAIAGISHKDLLLDTQIKLPALGVEVPLSRFFGYAPLALLLIYLGVILQFSSLADKVRALNVEINALPGDTIGGLRHQHPLRDNLSTFVITQALAGRAVSRGRMALLRMTSWLTLGVLPVLLLLFFQITFLPTIRNG